MGVAQGYRTWTICSAYPALREFVEQVLSNTSQKQLHSSDSAVQRTRKELHSSDLAVQRTRKGRPNDKKANLKFPDAIASGGCRKTIAMI
jgi:hypothetical protein